jgi:hypothetical protein
LEYTVYIKNKIMDSNQNGGAPAAAVDSNNTLPVSLFIVSSQTFSAEEAQSSLNQISSSIIQN